MHRQHALSGQHEVEHGEDRFLHFTGVLGASYQYEALFKVDDNDGFRACSRRSRVDEEVWHAEDGKAWTLTGQVALICAQEELARKEVVPGQFGNHLQRYTVVRVSASSGVQNI